MSENRSDKTRICAKTVLLHSIRLLAVFILILSCGFFVFAHYVSRSPSFIARYADGIVVLTGGEDRITEAVGLLASGKAKRMLISGVNPSTNAPQLISYNAVRRRDKMLFNCCVDLDKRALNTEDNATEAMSWVRQRGFESLIVVTSTYHMPRSLVELRQVIPDVELIPYPVKSPTLEQAWWSNQRTLWVLGKEYGKFVTAVAKYAAHSLIDGDNGRDHTSARMVNARAR